MSIKKQLENLLAYYTTTPRVGHTTTMIQGAKNVNSVIILVGHATHAKNMHWAAPGADFVPLDNLAKLQGRKQPLLIDNFAMTSLLSSALQEIERLERVIAKRIEESS